MKPFSKCKRPGQQVLGAKKGWLTNSRNYEDMHLAPSKYKSHEGAQKVGVDQYMLMQNSEGEMIEKLSLANGKYQLGNVTE